MFPGKTDADIRELVAEFFNEISSEFSPLTDNGVPAPRVPDSPFPSFEPYQISGILRTFKKPKSQVRGDISPKLITKFADLIVIPLTYIYNQVLSTYQWPELWKRETVIIIPKNSSPSDLSECRNLSCTPLFSKILESYLLTRLRKETSFADSQYGGLKGCGADHFLVRTWYEIMEALEDERAVVNLVSVDFEKAFNRMDTGNAWSRYVITGRSKHPCA